ncbi:MAG: nucleotidyltransferase domain-containing protein [Treponema sp.]|nr:nucleotidyltransferase domain-containing protein [Treponema sp.]
MGIDTINALEMVLKEDILKKYNLDKIGIFGSLARGEEANDIDLYIDSDTYNLAYLIPLKRELENITKKEVDIMLKKYANPIVLHRAQKDMVYVTQ